MLWINNTFNLSIAGCYELLLSRHEISGGWVFKMQSTVFFRWTFNSENLQHWVIRPTMAMMLLSFWHWPTTDVELKPIKLFLSFMHSYVHPHTTANIQNKSCKQAAGVALLISWTHIIVSMKKYKFPSHFKLLSEICFMTTHLQNCLVVLQ